MVALQILVLSVWVRVLVRQLLKKSPVGDFFVANLRVLVLISFPIFESKPFWRAKVLLFSDICKKKCSFSQKLHFFSLVCYAHLLSVGRLVLLRNVYLHAVGIKRRQARYSLFIIHYSLHSLPKAQVHLFIIQRSGSISVSDHPIKRSRDHLATIVYVTIAFFLHFFIIFLARFKKK